MRRILITIAAVAVASTALATSASAAKLADKVCSHDPNGNEYACIATADHKVPSGDTVTFTGTLSPAAMRNLNAWTKGDNIICLDRYKTKAEADGSWPWTMLEGACTTVRKNGTFTIKAEFGRKGTYFYGVENGPCRADAGMCGDGDPGLVGLEGKGTLTGLQVKTT